MRGCRVVPRRLVCSAVLACYVILAMVATAPHRHDLSPPASAPGGAGIEALSAANPPAPASPDSPRGSRGCWLCVWGRWSARTCPAVAKATETPAPEAVVRTVEEPVFLQGPVESNVLLRAPPTA
jgi:hypothetical protein